MAMFDENTIRIIAEQKIQAAMEAGEFEDLPGLGKPFEFDERDYSPNWWIKRKIEREKINELLDHKSKSVVQLHRSN